LASLFTWWWIREVRDDYLIAKRDEPTAVLVPVADYESLIEPLDLLSNAKAMRVLRAARAGKLSYRQLDLNDEGSGL